MDINKAVILKKLGYGMAGITYLIEFKKTLEVWLPKSMCKVLDENTIEVPVWLAAKNNLEEYED